MADPKSSKPRRLAAAALASLPLAVAGLAPAAWTGPAAAQQSEATPAAPAAQADAAAAPAEAPAPLIEQEALDLLKSATSKIAAAKSFSVEIDASHQVATTLGQMVTLFSDAEVTVSRPDKLKAEIETGAGETEFLFDGKKLTVFDKAKNFFAEMPAEGTVDALITAAEEKHGLELPAAEFLTSDPEVLLTKDVVDAYVIGPALVHGEKTVQLMFATPRYEWQLWLDDKTRLPVRYALTHLDLPGTPTYTAEFSDWKLDATPDAAAFTFTPPAGAAKIEFAPLPPEAGKDAGKDASKTEPAK
ncbi:hypothetical protein SAMN02745172_01687 [Pseudoxanthobacter soli DSM 19599]|uniref:Outer membrane lipoprotein-sorting protein n=1 Tax=Pseudoxanthobacter soli DSM 19599 TaxID=1123029 RepID=A0A1M7ZHS5_9HYPH|nr:DUF2092 domain-containing protein [Pseudoxanthobacter soli]SHO64372.1 hypothetical protein SAMN02745172_01687 [Pseudoxanthobacter soli DSM 19599]